MLIETQTTFAVRCPQCGALETGNVSRFDLARGRSVKLHCSCGSHKLTVGLKQKQAWVQVHCYLCDGLHFLYVPTSEFWSRGLKRFACTDTDLQLGVFGSAREAEHYVRSGFAELEGLLEDEGFIEYFDEPERMYRLLSRVQELGEASALTCTCGSQHITIDLCPDTLNLCCSACGGRTSLSGDDEEVVAAVEVAPFITVGTRWDARRKGQK